LHFAISFAAAINCPSSHKPKIRNVNCGVQPIKYLQNSNRLWNLARESGALPAKLRLRLSTSTEVASASMTTKLLFTEDEAVEMAGPQNPVKPRASKSSVILLPENMKAASRATIQ